MRLGIDLDGVVADFNTGWVSRYNHEFGSELTTDLVDSWNAMGDLTHFESMGAFWRWAARGDHGSVFRHLETYPEALETLERLAGNHDIVIISAKPDWAIHDTFAWIADRRIPTREVHITDAKWRVPCDVYLDDSPRQIVELQHEPPRSRGLPIRPSLERAGIRRSRHHLVERFRGSRRPALVLTGLVCRPSDRVPLSCRPGRIPRPINTGVQMRKIPLIVLVLAFALIAAACSSDSDDTTTTAAAAEETTTTTEAATTTTAAPETTTTEAMVEIGTADNPIKVLFVPSVSAEEIIEGGEILEGVLEEATGLVYEVSVPTSYAATISEMCASPENTVGFIPATAYVIGNDECGIEVAMKSLRFGFTEYWAEFIVPRDSDATSIADLAGKSWAYPDPGSTSGYLVPNGMFTTDGIEAGETVETGGHSAVVKAVYNEEADFGTVFFSPSIDADRNVIWDGTLADADVPDDLVDSCVLDADGEIECSGVYPRDARRNIREEAPDVIQKIKILELSQPIPNDTVSFAPAVSDEIKTKIVTALADFAANDPDGFSTAFDAYSWSGIALTDDSEFDFIRLLVQELGLESGDL